VGRLTRRKRRNRRPQSSRYQHVWLEFAELACGSISGRSQQEHLAAQIDSNPSPSRYKPRLDRPFDVEQLTAGLSNETFLAAHP
jgi:hypothetical protein